jgi:hypothetical protein
MNESVKVGHVGEMISLGQIIYNENRGYEIVLKFLRDGNIKSAYGVVETMCSYYKIHIYEDENNVSDSSDDSDESNNF